MNVTFSFLLLCLLMSKVILFVDGIKDDVIERFWLSRVFIF